jgi:hypothetical protein
MAEVCTAHSSIIEGTKSTPILRCQILTLSNSCESKFLSSPGFKYLIEKPRSQVFTGLDQWELTLRQRG